MSDELFYTFGKNLYRINSSVYGTESETANASTTSISPDQIDSGGSSEQQIQYVGALSAGKLGYTNAESGYILGVDAKDGIPKFYIGDTSNYLNWDGTTLSISGSITLISGSIAGMTITPTALTATSGGNQTILSSGATAFSAGPTGSPTVTITQAGVLTATGAVITGTLTATTGAIGGFDIGADYIRDAANSMGLASTVTGGDDVRFWAGDTFANRATADFRVTEAGAVTASSMTITGGSITTTPISGIPNNTSTDISLLEKSHNLVFSATDADTVAWSSGTITLSNGRTFSISAGNTGNMSALTYIYLDPGISSTIVLSTSTYSNAVGANKILLGVAQNNTVTASFIPYGPGQPLIDGANIGALSIVAGNIAASTITAGKLTVSQLSAITADLGAITAGSIVLPSGGFVRSGQTAYDSGTGFYIGNDSGTPKLSIGNSSGNKLTWNGTALAISGTLSAGSIDIPDAATADSFHVDADGDTWWGATTFGAAPASIDKAGNATFNSITAAGTMKLLKANSGASTTTTANSLDTVSITGLTQFDQIVIHYTLTQNGGGVGAASNVIIRNNTDSLTLIDIANTNTIAGGNSYGGSIAIQQEQQANTVVFAYMNGIMGGNTITTSSGATGTFANTGAGQSTTVTTAWTGTWTLALYNESMSGAGAGTLNWSWKVYKFQGQ